MQAPSPAITPIIRTATRWLNDFVGIKQDEAGNPTVCMKSKRFGGKDVRIDDFDGGKFISPSAPEAQLLAQCRFRPRRTDVSRAERLRSLTEDREVTVINEEAASLSTGNFV